jgi:hypothetical protein
MQYDMRILYIPDGPAERSFRVLGMVYLSMVYAHLERQ